MCSWVPTHWIFSSVLQLLWKVNYSYVLRRNILQNLMVKFRYIFGSYYYFKACYDFVSKIKYTTGKLKKNRDFYGCWKGSRYYLFQLFLHLVFLHLVLFTITENCLSTFTERGQQLMAHLWSMLLVHIHFIHIYFFYLPIITWIE